MATETFEKKYKTSRAAKLEFERTAAIYDQVSLAKPRHLRIAKPFKLEGDTICFEKIIDGIDVRKLICKFRVNTNVLHYVGLALAELHLAINPPINSLEENIHIHGDFTASNTLYVPAKNLVYIIDFAPHFSNKSESYCYGSAYNDLAHIVLALEIKYPMHKLFLLLRKKNRELSNRFFAGYEEAIGKKIDKEKLEQYIVRDIDIIRHRFSQKNPLSSFVWTRLFDKAKREYIN